MRELRSWVLHHLEDQIPKTPEQGRQPAYGVLQAANLKELAAFIAKIAMFAVQVLATPPNSMV
jgi:hypothetical protein